MNNAAKEVDKLYKTVTTLWVPEKPWAEKTWKEKISDPNVEMVLFAVFQTLVSNLLYAFLQKQDD